MSEIFSSRDTGCFQSLVDSILHFRSAYPLWNIGCILLTTPRNPLFEKAPKGVYIWEVDKIYEACYAECSTIDARCDERRRNFAIPRLEPSSLRDLDCIDRSRLNYVGCLSRNRLTCHCLLDSLGSIFNRGTRLGSERSSSLSGIYFSIHVRSWNLELMELMTTIGFEARYLLRLG